MRTFARLVNFSLCAAAATLLTHGAAAKEPSAADKKAASDGFKSCHEQEKYGDATTCWRVWYDKYQAIGGEAEVLYAQEKLKHAGVALPQPKAEEKPEAKPAPTPPKPPEPKPEKKKEAPAPAPAPSEAKPSEEPKGDETPAVGAADAAAVEAAPAVAVSVSGPNICEMKPDANAKGFSRKRVVVFSFADAESLETDPAIKTAGGAHHLREVFTERFPLDRFANVVTTFSGATGWESAPQLSKADIKQRIAAAKTDETGAALDRLSLMVDCADYIVFPTVTGHTVKPVAAQTKNGKQVPAGVQLTLSAKMGILKSADANSFTNVATLETNVPTFFDQGIEAAAVASAGAMSGATGALDSANKAASQAKNLKNQAENAADQVGNAAKQVGDAAGNLANGQAPGGLGLASGSSPEQKPAEDEPLIKNPMGALHERMSERCMKPKSSDDIVACEVRVRGYQAAMHFREDAASVEGWQLSGPLKYVGGSKDVPGISLGKEEALKIGSAFVVLGPDGSRLAYFKVTDVGPGGGAGETTPSKLALRMGDAPEGSELREYRKMGLEIELHGSGEAMPFNSSGQYLNVIDPNTGTAPVGDPYIDPKFLIGGGGSIGYDFSGLLSVNELKLRLGGEYLTGTGNHIDAKVIPLDLTIEKGFYLGKGLGFFLGLGPTLALVKTGVVYPDGTRTELSGKRIGAQGQAGLDILFSPSLTMRVSGVVHFHFGGAFSDLTYGSAPNGPVIWAQDDQLTPVDPKEPYSTLGGRLGFIYAL